MSESDVRIEQLHRGEVVGRGGEATVFTLASQAGYLVKVYHRPDKLRAEKLALMIRNPPTGAIDNGRVVMAWPIRRIFSQASERSVIGFIMPRVVAGEPASTLHNMRSRLIKSPHFHWQYLVRASRNISALLSRVHAAGYVIGDLNDGGILIANSAVASLVDCDSFQVRDSSTGRTLRCTVGMGLFTAPELAGANFADIDRTESHDRFGLAVIIYQLIMGSHPYSVLLSGPGDQPSIEDAIRRGLYPDTPASTVLRARFAVPYEVLPYDVRVLFRRAFGPDFSERPSPAVWGQALAEMERDVRTCGRNTNHIYAAHLANTCPWCERTIALSGKDPFPSNEEIRQGLHLRKKRPQPRPQRSTFVAPTAGAPPPQVAVASPSPPLQPPRALPPTRELLRQGARRGVVLGGWALLGAGLWFPALDGAWRGEGLPVVGAWVATAVSYASLCFALALVYTIWLWRRPVGQQTGPAASMRNWASPATGTGGYTAHSWSRASGGAVVASRNRRIFHRPQCEWAGKIGGRNRLNFASAQEATTRGYRPCRVCRP